MDDATDMYNNWASDDDVTKHLTWTSHKSIDESREIIATWLKELQQDNCYRWCIELKNIHQVIGTIDVVSLNINLEIAEIGYSDPDSVDVALDQAEKKIFLATQSPSAQKFKTIGSSLSEAWERFEYLA